MQPLTHAIEASGARWNLRRSAGGMSLSRQRKNVRPHGPGHSAPDRKMLRPFPLNRLPLQPSMPIRPTLPPGRAPLGSRLETPGQRASTTRKRALPDRR